MKIAIMGRTLDDEDGVGVANRNTIDKIIELDREAEYVVFYKTPYQFGRYSKYPHVKEILLRAPGKLLWDQVAIPYYAAKQDVDLIFNPKFTVPLLTQRPTVTICQGAEYYTFPQFYPRYEIIYNKLFMPLYYKRASKVLAVSDDLKDDLHQYVKVPYNKMDTMYLAADEVFQPKTNKEELETFRIKYNLPESFILAVTKPYQGKKLYPRKNIDNIVKSFLTVRKDYHSLKLVLAGSQCHRYISTVFGREMADDPGLVYPGWIPQEEMPHLYSLAQALVFPSFSESFGIPLVEAMACGCPVVTSTGGSCPEIVGDAALVVDPSDVEELSRSITTLLSDRQTRQNLSEKGFTRAREFSWTQSAKKVIGIFREIVADQ